MEKPKVNEVSWHTLYSKNGVEVYGDLNNPWIDYRVKLNGEYVERFYGETAHMDVTRYVHDIAIEFWDFNLDDIYSFIMSAMLEELSRR